jgi:putative ABC transport system permease protein
VNAWLRSWGISLRLARRGMLRSRGRSLLIIAMIGVPVLALTFAAVTYDTFTLTPDEKITRSIGTADASVQWFDDRDLDDTTPGTGVVPKPTVKTDERLLALLPAGSRVARYGSSGSMVRAQTASGVGRLSSAYLPVADPLTRGIVLMDNGTAPASDDEIAITRLAAERLGAGVGSRVTMLDPAGTFTVTAIVTIPDDLQETVVFRPGVLLRQEYARTGGQWLVDLPDGASPDTAALRKAGIDVRLRDQAGDPDAGQVQAASFGIATIAIGLTVFELVLLCGPAFAVGARRRQRELALVAANGGTAPQLRRITQADGVVLGLAGAVAGLILGIPLAVAARPFIEEYAVHRLAGSLRFFPAALAGAIVLAIVTGLLASLVPAVTAARQNVVAALAGRRGITRSRKRWILAGAVLAAGGAAVALSGAFLVSAQLILTGLVLGQLGLVVLTPSLIGLLGRFGRSLPLTARIALRDTARNRSSAAPAISAVMAVVAGSVTIGIYFFSQQTLNAQQYQMTTPLGYATVNLQIWDDKGGHPMDDATLATLTSKITPTLPADRMIPLQTVGCADDPLASCSLDPQIPADRSCPYDSLPPAGPQRDKALADSRCQARLTWNGGPMGQLAVDDGTNLALLTGGHGDELAQASQVLRLGGMVVADPNLVHNGQIDIEMTHSDADGGRKSTFSLPAYALTNGVSGFGAVVGPGALAPHGLASHRGMLLVATTRTPTTAEADRFQAAMLEVSESTWGQVETGPGHADTDLGLIVLALASAIVTLGATAVVTGLAAADGRADLTTLAAVGASPRVRRFMSLSQSGVIAGLGTFLGVAAGMGGAYAMIIALNRSMMERYWPHAMMLPLVTPWLLLAGILVVPLIAMAGAGLLTRSRLPIERRA